MPPLGVWMGQLNFSLPEWSEWLPLPRNNELTKVLLPHKCRRWSLLRLPPAEVCRLWSSGRDEFCWGCFWSPCVCSFKNLLGDAEASGDGEVSPGRSWICVWSSRYLINTLKERGHFFSKWRLAGFCISWGLFLLSQSWTFWNFILVQTLNTVKFPNMLIVRGQIWRWEASNFSQFWGRVMWCGVGWLGVHGRWGRAKGRLYYCLGHLFYLLLSAEVSLHPFSSSILCFAAFG